MSDLQKVEAEYKEVQSKLEKVSSQVNFQADVAQKEIKRNGALSEEAKAKSDEALSKMHALEANMKELAQKLERPANEGKKEPQTLGELVVNSEQFKNGNVNASFRGNIRVNAPRSAITTATADVVAPDRLPGIIEGVKMRLTIRDLLLAGKTSSNSIEIVKETGFTNAAKPVEEGGAKPYSDLTFGLVTSAVRTIPHLFKASKQILDDLPALMSYIDGRARYGLQLSEEDQLLNGNGSGANIHGILPQASSFSPSITIDNATPIDRIRLALLQAGLAGFPASGIVLNPIDWASIELIKDAQGRYLIGNPVNGTFPKLWNLPVVETQAMASNKFLVGAFDYGAQIFDRQEMEVLISTENDKDFENNMVTIRAEERLALAVYRPEAFVTGDVKAA